MAYCLTGLENKPLMTTSEVGIETFGNEDYESRPINPQDRGVGNSGRENLKVILKHVRRYA